MCGIAFLHAPHLDPAMRRTRMDEAIRRLNHRGPDAASQLEGNGCNLGHTRLAIVDLHGGHQPMRDPSLRWSLTFNGEIYNYRALRDALQGRWQFRDASDTEVLLAGLVLEGPEFISRLDGMWALVFHDAQSGQTLLSRDLFGKKPLYYRTHLRAFACGSEIPALAALLPDAPWQENPAAVADYFRFGYPLPGDTCWLGLAELPPAHNLLRSADGQLRTWRYWTPSTEHWHGTFEEAAETVRAQLVAAVKKRQLAADVEVGAFLSGGVDSTAVCALAQRNGFGTLRTFTAGFAEATYDERGPAARAAALLGTRHHAGEISLPLAAESARKFPTHLAHPFGDASLVPSAWVARLAGEHVKVVLTGDGGDEVFGGYARYAACLLRQRYLHLPAPLRRLAEKTVLAFREPIAHHSGSFLKRAHLFVAMAQQRREDYLAPPAMRSAVLEQLVPGLPATRPAPDLPWPRDADELRHMMLMDWLVWLPQDILTKVDRATMAHSVEARCPFLDRDLVEFVIRLPWQWHFSGLRGKRLLRAAIGAHTPKFVWHRKKQGFASPVAHWMRSDMGTELEHLSALQDTGPLERTALRALLQQHRCGVADHAQALWLAYCYLRWRAEPLR